MVFVLQPKFNPKAAMSVAEAKAANSAPPSPSSSLSSLPWTDVSSPSLHVPSEVPSDQEQEQEPQEPEPEKPCPEPPERSDAEDTVVMSEITSITGHIRSDDSDGQNREAIIASTSIGEDQEPVDSPFDISFLFSSDEEHDKHEHHEHEHGPEIAADPDGKDRTESSDSEEGTEDDDNGDGNEEPNEPHEPHDDDDSGSDSSRSDTDSSDSDPNGFIEHLLMMQHNPNFLSGCPCRGYYCWYGPNGMRSRCSMCGTRWDRKRIKPDSTD